MLQEENKTGLENYPYKLKVVISTTTKGGILELRLKKNINISLSIKKYLFHMMIKLSVNKN